jgi:hypothetical protein
MSIKNCMGRKSELGPSFLLVTSTVLSLLVCCCLLSASGVSVVLCDGIILVCCIRYECNLQRSIFINANKTYSPHRLASI